MRQVGATLHRSARPLTIAASLVAEHRLQTRRLSNCGSRAHLLHGMWDPPRPGLEPVSPALTGRFSTTAEFRFKCAETYYLKDPSPFYHHHHHLLFFSYLFTYLLFINLLWLRWVFFAACRIFSCSMWAS